MHILRIRRQIPFRPGQRQAKGDERAGEFVRIKYAGV